MKALRFYSTSVTFYEILELPNSSSINEIKKQFKVLSKKYHPDLNSHLGEDERKANNDKFIRIVNAYEILKDKKKKQEYDNTLVGSSHNAQGFRQGQTYNYSFNDSSRDPKQHRTRAQFGSRLNRSRHKVKNFNDYSDENSSFTGIRVNYGDRFDVPHFNYQEHLSKHLKFEQRIINKQLTDVERETILKQLTKNYDILELDEELVTKHLMRQVNKKDKSDFNRESINLNQSDPFIYRRPNNTYSDDNLNNENSGLKIIALLGGTTGSLLVVYKMIFG